MNKLNVSLLALALIACLALQCRAEDELKNEIEEGDSDVDESLDGGLDDDEADDGKEREYFSENIQEQWGRDIIQHGIQPTIRGRHQKCGNAKTAAVCSACCSNDGKSSHYGKHFSIRNMMKFRMYRCLCVSTQPKIIPN